MVSCSRFLQQTTTSTSTSKPRLIEPFLEPLDSNGAYILPTTQYIASAAIVCIFVYLVALVIMEINYFRFAVWMAWRRIRMERIQGLTSGSAEHQQWGEEEQLLSKVEERLDIENNDLEEEGPDMVDKNYTRSMSSSDLEMSASEEVEMMSSPSRSNNGAEMNGHHPEILHSDNDYGAIQIDQGITVVTQQQQQQPLSHPSTIHQDDLTSSKHSAIGRLLQDVRTNLSSLHSSNSPLRVVGKKNKSSSISIISAAANGSGSSQKCLNNIDQHDTTTLPNITTTITPNINPATLQKAYKTIHQSSLLAISSSLILYTITATFIALYTRGLKDEVIALIVGSSKFVSSVILFILSAKFPQWIGVYHEGAIRLAKCSSNLSIHFMNINLSNPQSIIKLRNHVLLGVSFHFAKFYILLLPFYCGVRPITIPFSILTGSITGFVLMWCIFLLHERHRNRRNIVAFLVIFVCSVMSSLLFVRGMAWIQVLWDFTIMDDENAFLIVSFFGWLVFMMVVHALFVWHTLRMERRYKLMEEEEEEEEGVSGTEDGHGNDTNNEDNREKTISSVIEERIGENGSKPNNTDANNDAGLRTSTTSEKSKVRRNKSYDSFLFDPRFQDDSFQGYKKEDTKEEMIGIPLSQSVGSFVVDDNNSPPAMESSTTVIEENSSAFPESDQADSADGSNKQRRRPDWCTIFMCFTPEYTKMSCFWKMIGWIKAVVIAISYLLCLYFVTVALGATPQIASTKEKLPSVRKALYETQNDGPVCAFDNRAAASNITTFENKDAAHEAGFLVLHCGACGACSNWENLIIEYTTRNNMAALANKCAMRGLFGGEEEINNCLMEPEIGFTGQCARCWTEDIVCTKKHCSFIFLQSQITNNVGNFAVGPDDITSATCEEAHCEVGAFVPCVGATRRRMNIISSIARPVEEQCQIVDVDWAELFAEYL